MLVGVKCDLCARGNDAPHKFVHRMPGRLRRRTPVLLFEARAMALRAVDLDPQNASFLDTLGWIYAKLEQYAEAKTWIGKAVETGQGNAAVYEHYGDVHARPGDWDAARLHWRKALELAPDNQALQEKLERQQF